MLRSTSIVKGHCDLIPQQIFFSFYIFEHQGTTNDRYKISAEYT